MNKQKKMKKKKQQQQPNRTVWFNDNKAPRGIEREILLHTHRFLHSIYEWLTLCFIVLRLPFVGMPKWFAQRDNDILTMPLWQKGVKR